MLSRNNRVGEYLESLTMKSPSKAFAVAALSTLVCTAAMAQIASSNDNPERQKCTGQIEVTIDDNNSINDIVMLMRSVNGVGGKSKDIKQALRNMNPGAFDADGYTSATLIIGPEDCKK